MMWSHQAGVNRLPVRAVKLCVKVVALVSVTHPLEMIVQPFNPKRSIFPIFRHIVKCLLRMCLMSRPISMYSDI